MKIVYCSFLEKLWISDAKAHLVLGTQDDDVGSVSQVSKVAQVKSQLRRTGHCSGSGGCGQKHEKARKKEREN